MAEFGYRVQVSFPTDAAVGADVTTNTWHFSKVGTNEGASIDAMFDMLAAFYDGLVTSVLSAQLDHTLVRYKAYDIEDDEPRIPVADEIRAMAAPTAGASLPHESAIVLSYFSQFESGINPASRRGRVYLGPLQRAVIEDSGSRVQLTTTARTAVATAADTMLSTSASSSLARWSTFSPKLWETELLTVALKQVTGGYVDNELDTQRRRGQLSSARSTFS